MKPATLFRIGGFCVATCSALLGGPAAIASAQPSDSNHRVAPTAPANATANASSSPTGLGAVIEADAARRVQLLEGQQVKLQQSTAKIEGAEQTKLGKEQEALVGSKKTAAATHLQSTASNQQLLQAMAGITSGIAVLHTLSDATKSAEKADAAALKAQFAVNEAALLAAHQAQVNALTADLLSTLAKFQQANIDTARMIARG